MAMVVLLGFTFLGAAAVTVNDCESAGAGAPGYWVSHPKTWPAGAFDEVTLGGHNLDKNQTIDYMERPVKCEKKLTMFRAFVAAKLKVINGSSEPPPVCVDRVDFTLAEVNQWLTTFPVLDGVKANSEAWQYGHGEALYWCMDDYNNGFLNVQLRDDLE